MLPFVFFKCICKSKSIFSKKLEKNYELPRKTCDFAQSVLYFLIINRYNIQNKVLSQSRRLPPLSGGECQQICLSGNPISDWDKRSARMRSDSVKNMSAYADQNHAPSLAVARLELVWHYSCDAVLFLIPTFIQIKMLFLGVLCYNRFY